MTLSTTEKDMTNISTRTPPSWAENLVIYELNPKAFTSPQGVGDGSGSGTFTSLKEKLPYLADLGVNGIWMAGHHVATSHFYGIWTVYACLEPDRIDPTLGTPDEMKDMISAAHDVGIRVFLDVIAHGVLHEAPIVASHPEWFTSSSWGMSDFDYSNADFREWWIQIWVNYALEFEVDGFRIDVAMGDIAVWDEIVNRVRKQGRDIVVFPENERYHFSQQDIEGVQRNLVRSLHINDFLGHPRALETQQLSCHDYGWEALPGNHYYLKGSRALAAHGALLGPHIPLFMAGEEFDADPTPLPNLTQGLFGTGGPGGWLYGNRIDWSQLDTPAKAAMLADVKQMLALRRQYPHILNANSAKVTVALVHHDGITSLVPYALGRDGREALLILANVAEAAVESTIRVPRTALGIDPAAELVITDAITGERQEFVNDTLTVRIGADRTPGGGYRVLHVAST